MAHPVEIDLLERAREHRWWYSDTNMATLLMHEVERLHKEVANRAHSEEQYRQEIERLHELILTVSNNIASSPAKVLEESVLVGKALDRLAQQDQEIERLREIIRDLDNHEGAEGWSEELRERVREALGDKP